MASPLDWSWYFKEMLNKKVGEGIGQNFTKLKKIKNHPALLKKLEQMDNAFLTKGQRAWKEMGLSNQGARAQTATLSNQVSNPLNPGDIGKRIAVSPRALKTGLAGIALETGVNKWVAPWMNRGLERTIDNIRPGITHRGPTGKLLDSPNSEFRRKHLAKTRDEWEAAYGPSGGGTMGKSPPPTSQVKPLEGNIQSPEMIAVDQKHARDLDLQGRLDAKTNKIIDTAATKYTPSEVRRMTSGLHYNEGVGRWTAPRNSIRLMKANQEGLLPNQGQIAKTVSNQGWNLPLSGMKSADLGKTFGNIGSFPIPTESLLKNQNFANLGTASNAFTPGAAATNPVSFGAGAGAAEGVGASAGAGAGAGAQMGIGLAINAFKAMLGKLLDPHANKQILAAQNRPNVSSGNEDLWSRFYTG